MSCPIVYNAIVLTASGDAMKTTNDFLDMLKAKRGLASDYALGKLLGYSTSRIGNYRKNRSFLEDDQAVLIAEMLEIDPAIVLASVHYERAKKAEEKAVWKGIFEKLGGLAAGVMLGFALFSLGGAAVYSDSAEASNSDLTPIYIIRSDRTPKLPALLVIPLIPFFPLFLQYIRRR